MSYHSFLDDEGKPFGSFEVFRVDEKLAQELTRTRDWQRDVEPGWYWWVCIPGCLPDSDAEGPFHTEWQAIENALEG